MQTMISLLLVVCLHTSLIHTAPLQVQLLQPMLQPQQTSLQKQLMALQQIQLLQRLNGLQYSSLNVPRPLLILLPKHDAASVKISHVDQIPNMSNLRNQDLKNHETENDEGDSIVIDADPTESHNRPAQETPNAILLMPNNGRFSLGGFISSIPFLPIEINVPDSISWIYNGISSIFSGIGQRIPFRPQTLDALESMNQNEGSMRIKSLNTQAIRPIIVIPTGSDITYV